MKIRLAALAGSLVLSVATPAIAQEEEPIAEPLGSRAMTSDLSASYGNGRLPDSTLAEVSAGANERCYLEPSAAATWQLLVDAAAADGVTGFAAGWCYRSLGQQRRTYARNCGWQTEPAPPPVEGEPVEPPPRRWVCDPPTAPAGTSNHGWGRAVDVVDTTTRKAHVLNCRDPQFAWLTENAPRFGWVLPQWARCGSSRQEPWHWEWAGVSVPISQLSKPPVETVDAQPLRSTAAREAAMRLFSVMLDRLEDRVAVLLEIVP